METSHATLSRERTFADPFEVAINAESAQLCAAIIENDALFGVTWVQAYITPEKRKAFCICDAPMPEAIRRAAQRNRWPVDRITEVRVLDPHFYF